jgi:poly(A) polymerase Pap1
MQDRPAALQLLLLKFFKFYSKWEWPNPINLMNCPQNFLKNEGPKKSWNPITSSQDSQHLMPIITPEIGIKDK